MTISNIFRRGIYKLTIGKIKYYKKSDYDAAKYWRDRFSKYGLSFKGSGNEGLSENENKREYSLAAEIFKDLCKKENVNFENSKVLEIGVGTAYYALLLSELGVKQYVGADITDILFDKFQKALPFFNFVKKDITTQQIGEEYDLIVMIDVIEHIVNQKKFSYAMQNIKNCLSKNGILILAPVSKISKTKLFYIKHWSLEDIKKEFNKNLYIFGELMPFRSGYILAIKKKDIKI